ncbi:OLC1v1002328C1 [Oldenlandia corymbosa var. corymbosa]|uniref:OLC1v1002328C1 n=1 Tax=Oldenlandia corymbosa var. corymbosa TaxID=529605 RepID=A0AAV1D7G6_OLDCO|nr:OLC1v1002328C1 [Oldenlandia corymbosa var. corymbosa]
MHFQENIAGMDCLTTWDSPYRLILQAAMLIPISHYLLGAFFVVLIILYNFFEIHFLEDLFTGFRGQPVHLAFNPSSHVYRVVGYKCKLLHSRYLSTPWICSPHFQTAFLSFFGNSPVTKYRRQLFKLDDGGTLALDWLMHSDAAPDNDAIPRDTKKIIVIVIPGLTSDSNSSYVRHLVSMMAKRGWHVVVANHRGLGGVSITSDCFYNAGWTDDIRKVVDYIHSQYPEAPLFTIGTSIGANMLVKYLGEEGTNVPVIGAAAICCPWDPLLCDRFINRRLVQRFYSKVLALGLKGYAKLHQMVLSRLADWEGISRSRTLRDFDTYATRIVANCATVDTYYRRCCSALYLENVKVPLLCINASDDPICTKEAIPWDECRENRNIILAVTKHGGHLAYFEGIMAKSLWWVRALEEFLFVLHSSPLSQREKQKQMTQVPSSISPQKSSKRIDDAPFVSVKENGLVAANGNGPINKNKFENKISDTEWKSEEARNAKDYPENGELSPGEAEALLDDGNDMGMVPVRRRKLPNHDEFCY